MKLYIKGDIERIVAGNMDLSCLHFLLSKEIFSGLGAVAVNEKGFFLGEAIAHQNIIYGYCPQKTFKEEKSFLTPFFTYIKSKPKLTCRVNEPIVLQDFYNQKIKEFEKGFVITGSVNFSKLSARYLKLPPTNNECILDHIEKYVGALEEEKIQGEIFGVVLCKHNKNITTEKYPTHTHVKLGNKAYHLLSSSQLTRGKFCIEAIDELIFE